MTNLTAFDLREISHGPGRFSYLVQQPEPVGPQFPILDIDRDLVEERVHMRAELRHGGHGGGEILLCDGGICLGFGNGDGAGQFLFFGLCEQACVRRTGVGGVILLLLDAEDIRRAFRAGKKMFAGFGAADGVLSLGMKIDHILEPKEE